MKTCPNCNTQIPDEDEFCTNCGAKFEEVAQQDVPQQETSQQEPAYAPPVYGYDPQQQYAPQPIVNEYDHTTEFDAQDISDNKVFCMTIYLLGVIGIIIALLVSKESRYTGFHVRQALKIQVCEILCIILGLIGSIIFIGPFLAAIALAVTSVLRIICFIWICQGRAIEVPIIRNFGFLK